MPHPLQAENHDDREDRKGGSTLKEKNVVSLQDFLSQNIKRCKKSQCRIFGLTVPSLFKELERSPSYFPDPDTKHDAHDNGV